MDQDDDLLRWRAEFPILERAVYMISNSLGAMPRGVADSLAEYATTWATRGVRAWEERWWEMALEVGDRIAAIIGAPPRSVSMHENVTSAAPIALSTVTPQQSVREPHRLSRADFPSTIYPLPRARGVGLRSCDRAADADLNVRTERVIEAIDERTAVVSLSHVLFKTSFIDRSGADRSARARGRCTCCSTAISRQASFRSTSRRSASISSWAAA